MRGPIAPKTRAHAPVSPGPGDGYVLNPSGGCDSSPELFFTDEMSVVLVGAIGVRGRAGYAQVEPEMDYGGFPELVIETERLSLMPGVAGS